MRGKEAAAPGVLARLLPAGDDVEALVQLNLTLEQYHGDQHKLDMAIRYLFWFLPRSYALAPLPEGWSDSGFTDLA